MSDNNIKLIGNHKGIEIKFTIDSKTELQKAVEHIENFLKSVGHDFKSLEVKK
jgi:hypothetical protein